MGYQDSSYYRRGNSMSPALIRARKPYLLRNAITGITLTAMSVSIYLYTLHVIGQDNFEDVKPPPLRQAAQAATDAKK